MILIAVLVAACGGSAEKSSGATTTSGAGGSASTAGNTASAPGVTPTTVTVGQIADISEPVTGLFKSAQVGVQAYFDYINSQGGVYGRRLVLDSHDSLFQQPVVTAAANGIAKNDLAFVGNYTLLDPALKSAVDSGVPNIGSPLGSSLAQDANTYDPAPSTDEIADLGPFQWFKQKYPKAVKHAAILYANASPSAAETYQVLKDTWGSLGYDIVYARGFGAFETTFQADVVHMKSLGVQFFWFDGPANYAATIAKEFALQNFNPIIYEVAGYGSNLVSLGGSAVNGMYLPLASALFLGQDAKTTPVVATFDKWMAQVDSTDPVASWGASSWASADLFVQALKAAGRNPTRASLVAALNKITSFNAHGLVPTSNPAQNIPSPCWLLAQVKNGAIARVSPSPARGFICNPGGQLKLPGYAAVQRPTS
jgi:ABC-type branched-subunit amino acid transport system substrate-binding protein